MNASPRTIAHITRRKALLASATVGAAAVVPVGTAAGASAAVRKATRTTSRSQPGQTRTASARSRGESPRPAAAESTLSGKAAARQAALPDARTRQVVSSFGPAVTDARLAAVADAGGIEAWFEDQLSPDGIADQKADATWSWWPSLAYTPQQRFQRHDQGIEDGWQMMQSLASYVMMRRLLSNKPVEESMVDFWSNHLHVASPIGTVWVQRVEYEETIRKFALGRFEDLLIAAIQHPAMGMYLSNVDSTAAAINENLGRELLELHTLGVGNYTEDDVINSARILTGFHIDKVTWKGSYVPADHWVGKVKVKGFSSANKKPNGLPVLIQYLKYLASHPLTAKRICTKLAVRFMSDTPSKALITSLTKVYLDSGTAIVPVLRALVASNEFKATYIKKVRTPVEDALATWAVLGAVVTQPKSTDSAANQIINVSKAMGQVVYDWPTPDAFPDVAPAWCGAGRILGSMRCHWDASTGSTQLKDVTFPAPIDWMPQLPTMFSDVVDHVAQGVLFMPSTAVMLEAACIATDFDANEMINDETHALIRTRFPRLMVSILDTVEHMSR